MARKTNGRRLTLSEHLALRTQEAEKTRAKEEARMQSINALRELDARVVCNCPACVKLRQKNRSD